MKTDEALMLLVQKMDEHGLSARGWTGGLDRAVQRFGVCVFHKKRITLSRHLVALNGDHETLDTILHEIAHALAWQQYGKNCGHDTRWRHIAKRIGARPERTMDPTTTIAVPASYYLVHADTGEVFRPYHRRPRRDLSQTWIRGRRKETFGRLVVVSAAELTPPTH